jgi:diguanylate cyclase (GGDEF) domain
MFGNHRKTIGVFISQVNEEFPDALSKGIITRAKELDYNVALFTNFGGLGQADYDLGEAYISDLPNYEELDGIVITPDVIDVPHLLEDYKDKISRLSHCPAVSVRREIKEYYNVLINDNAVLDEIIRHFIVQHGYTRINFLSGPEGFPDTEKRLENYKRLMKEYNMPIEEERIYHGDLLRVTGKNAVEYWLNSSLEMPQAIVCANDNMAITVCRALAERGISVPDQIAVTGCDDIEDAAEFSPSITTARMPIFEMGMEAVNKIDRHNRGIEQPQTSLIKTVTMYRASCGCKRNWYHESNVRRRNHIQARETLQLEIARNAYMSIDLTGLTRLEDILARMWNYVAQNENLSHFCMCLENGWDHYHVLSEEGHCVEQANQHDNDELTMEIGLKNDVRFMKLKCSREELIPPELVEDKPMAYFFALLHHQEHCFGYVGVSFDKVQTYMRTFQMWLINVSNALENVRIHGELNRLVYKLEDMSVRDDLTGLYNRRVLVTLGKKYLKHCLLEHTNMMVFTADMDKLKYINDKFGHFYGDIAIRVVANALLYAADDDEICIRLGGDEFMAIGMDYDESRMEKFIHRFVEELNKFNFVKDYDFSVYVSYGYHLVLPEESTTIENCLSAADALMYQQKYEKTSKSVKANLIS